MPSAAVCLAAVQMAASSHLFSRRLAGLAAAAAVAPQDSTCLEAEAVVAVLPQLMAATSFRDGSGWAADGRAWAREVPVWDPTATRLAVAVVAVAVVGLGGSAVLVVDLVGLAVVVAATAVAQVVVVVVVVVVDWQCLWGRAR
jgi:hypothetical protein